MNRNTNNELLDLLLSPGPEENESQPFVPQNNQTNVEHSSKQKEATKPKDWGKLKNGRSVYLSKYSGTPARRKAVPVCVYSNPNAEAVLRERKVEIKDLECEVTYLKNIIKDLKVENKTLQDIQSRQDKELKKLKGGVADIPALLRSHKEEIKASESVVTSLRRELCDCQKDLKTKSDIILRKDQHLDKLNLLMKRNEKRLQEISLQNKQLKEDNRKYEQENKKLVEGNEEVKATVEGFKKKTQDLTSEILTVKEKFEAATHTKSILESEICKLQKKYENSLENQAELRKLRETTTVTVEAQTDIKEFVSQACMTISLEEVLKTTNKSSLQTPEVDATSISTNTNHKAEGDGWYQKYGLRQAVMPGIIKPLPTDFTTTAKEYNSDDIRTKTIRTHSLQPIIPNKNISCPDAINFDYMGRKVNQIFVSEDEKDCNIPRSKDRYYVPNERQNSKRLFSNFNAWQ